MSAAAPQRFLIALALLSVISLSADRSVGEFEQWCVADEQTPDDELQTALDWACGQGGADCTKIQANGPCYLPNTVRAHASYAFNSYYQHFKNRGGSCFFRGAAMITELDPSKHTGLNALFLLELISQDDLLPLNEMLHQLHTGKCGYKDRKYHCRKPEIFLLVVQERS